MVSPAGFEPAASSSRTRRAFRCATARMEWWRRWDSNPYHSLARRMLCPLSYIPLAFPAGIEPASAVLEVAILILGRREPWGRQQASNLFLDAGNVALFLLSYACPGLATSQVVKERSACSGRVAGAARKRLASAKKSGTPPGIRTRNFMFLRHARIPIPPAGQTKSPGTLRCNPGFGRKQTQFRRQLSPSVPVARARAWPNARYSASRAMPFGSRPIRGCNVVQSISILMVFVVAGPVLTLLFLRR